MRTKQVSVSFNRPIDDAITECEQWEEEGYLVTETYWNDWDCGQILELPEEGNDVHKRHLEHMAICEEQARWRKEHFNI
jgi:hypothetical protein